MQYKPSIFNTIVQNSEGDYLVYNSCIGTRSFLKLSRTKDKDTYECLVRKCTEARKPNSIRGLEVLIQKGLLVPVEKDERYTLRMIYQQVINDSTLELTILPTEACNFRCRYCYESFQNGIMSENIQKRIISFVNKNLRKYTGLSVSWFGGEPLEAIDVIDNLSKHFIDVCSRQKKIYTAGITTNAYNLDVDMARRLYALRVIYYQITIDGMQSTHDRQRPLANGEPTFNRIVSNLLNIKNNIKNKTITFSIRTNFTKEILNDIDHYIEYFSSHFGDDDRFRFFVRPVMDWGGERVKTMKSSMFESKDAIADIYQSIINVDNRLPMNFEGFFEPGGSVCYAAKKNAYVIDSRGNVHKCTCNFDEEANSKIGEIDSEGNMRLDSYKQALWLCDATRCHNEECSFRGSCLGECCPAKRVINGLDRPQCPLEKENIEQTLCLIDRKNNSFERLPI